jgi:hypothetical protein
VCRYENGKLSGKDMIFIMVFRRSNGYNWHNPSQATLKTARRGYFLPLYFFELCTCIYHFLHSYSVQLEAFPPETSMVDLLQA